MDPKSIIKTLQKAINEKKSADAICLAEDILVKNIAIAANEPLFYSLPINEITKIINKRKHPICSTGCFLKKCY